jgi:hypothetical protein
MPQPITLNKRYKTTLSFAEPKHETFLKKLKYKKFGAAVPTPNLQISPGRTGGFLRFDNFFTYRKQIMADVFLKWRSVRKQTKNSPSTLGLKQSHKSRSTHFFQKKIHP